MRLKARTTEFLTLTHHTTLNLPRRDKFFKVRAVALESAGQVYDWKYQRGQHGVI